MSATQHEVLTEMLESARRDEEVRDAFLHEAEAPRHLMGGNAMSVDERYAYVAARAQTPEDIQAEYDRARDALTQEYLTIQKRERNA
jgi:hypothetical protein